MNTMIVSPRVDFVAAVTKENDVKENDDKENDGFLVENPVRF